MILVARKGYLPEDALTNPEKRIFNRERLGDFPLLTLHRGHALRSRIDLLMKELGIQLDLSLIHIYLGVLSAALRYEGGLSFTKTQQLLNLLLMAVLVVVLWFIASRWQKHVPEILMIGTAAIFCMSIFNAVGISDSVEVVKEQAEATKNDAPTFTLSKTGQNVIVLMMDRGMNAYVPYIFRCV